jgi:hypothetical protein
MDRACNTHRDVKDPCSMLAGKPKEGNEQQRFEIKKSNKSQIAYESKYFESTRKRFKSPIDFNDT